MTAAEAPSKMVVTDALEEFGKLNIGVERATAIANQLKPIVDEKGLAVRIGSGEHLKVEAWVTLGMFCGVTPQTEWTQEVRNPKSGALEGYKARVQVIRMATGEAIGAAECGCHFDEQQKRRDGSGLYDRWIEHGRQNRHACMSMAQTRATSKALAQALRWIPVLAGYSGTPFEEMPPQEATHHAPAQPPEAHGDREEERLPPPPSGPPNEQVRKGGETRDKPSDGGNFTKAQAKPLWRIAFQAAEAAHGTGKECRYLAMDHAMEVLNYDSIYKAPVSKYAEIEALLNDYAPKQAPPPASADVGDGGDYDVPF